MRKAWGRLSPFERLDVNTTPPRSFFAPSPFPKPEDLATMRLW